MTVTVKPCRCLNSFQDKQYGSGLRLHNARTGKQMGDRLKGLPAQGWVCTVCGEKKAG